MAKPRYLRLLGVFVWVSPVVFGLASVSAASANISHSYQSTNAIPDGSIVSLDPTHAGYIQLASTANSSRLLGVALASKDSLLAVDPTANKVQVATSGSVNTLVTTLNGDIKVGDQISISPFNGVGMEVAPGVRIVGVAQTAFSHTVSGATTEQVKDKSGANRQIIVGYVRLSISIGSSSGSTGGAQANFLQKLVKPLTGHTISTVRIILSIVVSLVALISLITIIYASIYGSIISIGRNPLAQRAVFHTLLSVMVMAVITVGIAGLTIYYLLR